MKYYLAIDIGATSGRHIVGWMENDQLYQSEVYRFKNGSDHENGHRIWNLDRLFAEVKNGIRCAFSKYPTIQSLSIDTWGADYVLMNNDTEILPCYTYRDFRTDAAIPKVHAIMPYEDIYSRTGYQCWPYNTIYQLFCDHEEGRLASATDFLMMPEYLMYRLCGVKSKEATNNSTTSLVDPYTGKFDLELTRALGFPDRLFPQLSRPGTVLGPLLPEVAEEVGGTCSVVLCATHDTESAISALPMEQDQLYISSGTWSLLGVRLQQPNTSMASAEAGFSNEGGLDYICYLTNIPGMWIVEQLRKELCPEESFGIITQKAEESGYSHKIDPADPAFNAPQSMKEAIDQVIISRGYETPKTLGDYFSCVYHSLAACYDRSIRQLEGLTKASYHSLYITGGGSKNDYLNRLTESYTGKKVYPIPMEASSAGSILIQMKAN